MIAGAGVAGGSVLIADPGTVPGAALVGARSAAGSARVGAASTAISPHSERAREWRRRAPQLALQPRWFLTWRLFLHFNARKHSARETVPTKKWTVKYSMSAIPQRQNKTFQARKVRVIQERATYLDTSHCTAGLRTSADQFRLGETKMRYSIIALTVAGLLATPVLAQTPMAPKYVTIGASDALASNIVGLDVYNAGNENVGEIADLALDGSRNVKGLILSVGGFLGLGSKYVVLDPDSVNVRYDEGAKQWKATMDVTKDQLNAAPEYKYAGKFND